MDKRRSMGDALAMTPEKLAFIQSGKQVISEAGRAPAKVEERAEVRATVENANAEPHSPPEPKARRGRKPKAMREVPPLLDASAASQEGSPYEGFSPLLVPLNTRLTPATSEALRRASLERRLERRRPHTQQDIVEAAIRNWLRSNGFGQAA